MQDITDYYGPEVATFGDRVAAAREAAGMTPEVLAKRLGIKLVTLQRWEDDVSEPRANKLSTLSGVLNVSMVWLITGEGDGVEAPAETLPVDLREILDEMRSLRAQIKSRADTLGRLEKRLRKLLKEQA